MILGGHRTRHTSVVEHAISRRPSTLYCFRCPQARLVPLHCSLALPCFNSSCANPLQVAGIASLRLERHAPPAQASGGWDRLFASAEPTGNDDTNSWDIITGPWHTLDSNPAHEPLQAATGGRPVFAAAAGNGGNKSTAAEPSWLAPPDASEAVSPAWWQEFSAAEVSVWRFPMP